ncbi:MAG: hypothetical protein HYV09_30170 [Deltaproteobacteria bacterium]|nr:hypothetical protein [Deltaproteobacteria bacterium]
MTSLSRAEIHRRALLAATKVSLSAALIVGCGGRLDHEMISAAEGDTGAANGSDAAEVTVAEAGTLEVSVLETGGDTSARGDASACGLLVESALADAGEPVTTSDPALQACCREILPAWTTDGDFGVGYRAARACCYVVGGESWWEIGGAACTPWGPPMPPEMRAPDEGVA